MLIRVQLNKWMVLWQLYKKNDSSRPDRSSEHSLNTLLHDEVVLDNSFLIFHCCAHSKFLGRLQFFSLKFELWFHISQSASDQTY